MSDPVKDLLLSVELLLSRMAGILNEIERMSDNVEALVSGGKGPFTPIEIQELADELALRMKDKDGTADSSAQDSQDGTELSQVPTGEDQDTGGVRGGGSSSEGDDRGGGSGG